MMRRPVEDARLSKRSVKSSMNAFGKILFFEFGGTLYMVISLSVSDAVVIIT